MKGSKICSLLKRIWIHKFGFVGYTLCNALYLERILCESHLDIRF